MKINYDKELSLVKSIIESKNRSTFDDNKIRELREMTSNYNYTEAINFLLEHDDLLNQSIDLFALFLLMQQRGSMKGIGGFSDDIALLSPDEINERCVMYDQRFGNRNELRKQFIEKSNKYF